MECIEDDAMDEAHGKLSWYRDRYQDAVKNAKSLQEQLDSEKERCRKAESELHDLRKEVKGKGKQKEMFPPHANGVSGSPLRTLTWLSKRSAKAQGRDGGGIQDRRTFNRGE